MSWIRRCPCPERVASAGVLPPSCSSAASSPGSVMASSRRPRRRRRRRSTRCRARRPLRRQVPGRRDDRHRQRAGRSDVDGPLSRLREPVRRRGADRDHVDVDENKVRPDVIQTARSTRTRRCSRSLARHAAGFPDRRRAAHGRRRGQPGFGMDAVGPARCRAGAELISARPTKPDPRPLWVLAWGGANTLAQALMQARATRTPQQLDAIVAKLRVYAISDQDDAGPWIRREFPRLHYIAMPSTPDGEQYYLRRGPASAAIGSTRTRRARTSRRSRRRG